MTPSSWQRRTPISWSPRLTTSPSARWRRGASPQRRLSLYRFKLNPDHPPGRVGSRRHPDQDDLSAISRPLSLPRDERHARGTTTLPWRGHDVVDSDGHKIGELEAVYVDTSTDLP